jgi:hypothetical protein
VKSVRYGLALAGLAPAAGLMMPNVAYAATDHAAPSVKPAAKTVSLHAVVPEAGCTGSIYTGKIARNGMSMWFWHTPELYDLSCIGTVEGFLPDSRALTTGSDFRVRVWVDGGLEYSYVNSWVSETDSGFYGRQGIHDEFGKPVEVCAAWLSAYDADVIAGPICDTV